MVFRYMRVSAAADLKMQMMFFFFPEQPLNSGDVDSIGFGVKVEVVSITHSITEDQLSQVIVNGDEITHKVETVGVTNTTTTANSGNSGRCRCGGRFVCSSSA